MADLLSVFGRLLFLVLLTVGALLALRRWMRPPTDSNQALRVVARTGLTRSAVVAIVAVGRRHFLLGASDAGVRMLQELEPASAPEGEGERQRAGGRGPVVSEGTDPVINLPRNGLVDWLRERTVRTPSEGSGHAVHE